MARAEVSCVPPVRAQTAPKDSPRPTCAAHWALRAFKECLVQIEHNPDGHLHGDQMLKMQLGNNADVQLASMPTFMSSEAKYSRIANRHLAARPLT